MKKYILLLLFSFTLVLITSFALHTESDDVNLCHSDILWIKDNGTDDGLMLKSKTSILVTSDNMGRMNMYGYVKENNVFYRLDRALYFNYQSIDKKIITLFVLKHYLLPAQITSLKPSSLTSFN
ncbi:hypothetical protein AB6H14_20530 [Providencia vermicola]